MRPANRLLLVLFAWAAAAVLVAVGWLRMEIWFAAGGVLAFFSLLDALALRNIPRIDVYRQAPAAFALDQQSEITLKLRCSNERPVSLDVFDHHPGGWLTQGIPRRVLLEPNRETRLRYQLRPLERGLASFGKCQLRLWSPLRLWSARRMAGVGEEIRVYPNFSPLARFALISAERASRISGAHRRRRRGEGTEFHQLREFRIGDSLRQVDWKATARMRRPISREYQVERDQQVVIVLDTGRRMLAKDGELSHFDHVLNAALMLSYLALRQGDAVGLLTTGKQPRWLPPQRGAGAINVILNSLYNLQAEPLATDFRATAMQLSQRQNRRALIMLASNLRDDDVEEMIPAIQLLSRRHLVCIASLREQALDDVLDTPVRNLTQSLLAGGVAHYLLARDKAHNQLRRTGAPILDVTCAQLPAAMTEAYLSIKRSGRL